MKLTVPYIAQINVNACGAAALAMMYGYHGVSSVTQEELMEKYRELEPHGSGNFRLSTNSLVRDAQDRGLAAGWNRANWRDAGEAAALLQSALDAGIPLIVCQIFTESEPLIGHFRVVTGMEDGYVYLHDPHPVLGGENLKWPIEMFLRFWRATGENVTGGVSIFMHK
jgi:predicted double-glycine peptidase